jgi:hypothetical protein
MAYSKMKTISLEEKAIPHLVNSERNLNAGILNLPGSPARIMTPQSNVAGIVGMAEHDNTLSISIQSRS